MSKITVCLDCPDYEKGGWCRHGRKTVTDQTLVDELRSRGWEVTCTRTVIQTL